MLKYQILKNTLDGILNAVQSCTPGFSFWDPPLEVEMHMLLMKPHVICDVTYGKCFQNHDYGSGFIFAQTRSEDFIIYMDGFSMVNPNDGCRRISVPAHALTDISEWVVDVARAARQPKLFELLAPYQAQSTPEEKAGCVAGLFAFLCDEFGTDESRERITAAILTAMGPQAPKVSVTAETAPQCTAN